MAEIAALHGEMIIPASRAKVWRPNPKREYRPPVFHACGLCGHGGGTLKRTHECIEECVVDPCVLKQDFKYAHTETRFCQEWHFPKRLMAPVIKKMRQMQSRAKQEFHRTGRWPGQAQRTRQKAV